MILLKEQIINTRHLTQANITPGDEATEANKNYLFDLSYLGLVNLNGDKSIDFLQGQLTCDLNTVTDIQIAQGIQCNLKGRILSLMDIINWNGIKLVLPVDLIDQTITSLGKTALLSKVTLQKNTQYRILGFHLQNAQDLIPESIFLPQDLYSLSYGTNYCCYHLGKGFYIIIVHQDKADEFMNQFIELNQFKGSFDWHILRLMHRQFEIYPESRGLFLPHRLGLHETSLISFNKGCYKGQEIIARTHYKATIKHELRIYSINSEQEMYSGQKLFRDSGDTEVGELIDYSSWSENKKLIVVSILKEPFQAVRFEGADDSTSLELLNFR